MLVLVFLNLVVSFSLLPTREMVGCMLRTRSCKGGLGSGIVQRAKQPLGRVKDWKGTKRKIGIVLEKRTVEI